MSHALPLCVCGCLWLWSVPAPVKTPPRADDPRPSLAQIMDATNFLSDKRLMQIDRKDGYTTGVELCKFEHVHGSTVCSSLFEHRVQPDGRVVHYYMTDKMNELVGQCDGGFVVVMCPSGVDIAVVRCRHDLQIRDDELHAPEAPLSIADVCSAHCIPLPPLPPAAVRPTILSPFHPTPVASVKPVGHLLPCATHTCHGNSAEACDHFGVFPDVPMQLNGVVDAEMLRAEEEAEKSGFTIDGSVFWPRLFTSESQCTWGCKQCVRLWWKGAVHVTGSCCALVVCAACFDEERVFDDGFNADFRALTLTPSFVKLLKQQNVSTDVFREVMRGYYSSLLCVFHYFACTSGTFVTALLKANCWSKLLTNMKLLVKTKGAFGVNAKVCTAVSCAGVIFVSS